MATVEYIAKIKGDTSALEAALQKAEGRIQKLNEDEVILKLNYDGNIKAFNKVFEKVMKACPEIDIQFQYNINKKILDQKISELQKMDALKVDIDTGNVKAKIKDMVDALQTGFESAEPGDDELKQRVRDLYAYINTATAAGVKNLKRDFTELEELDDFLDGFVSQIAYSDKPIQLFKIDTDFENTIQKASAEIADLKTNLESLLEHGAKELSGSAEIDALKDDIRILNADIAELRDQMNGSSGKLFQEMQDQVDVLNQKLAETTDTLARLQNPDSFSLGNTLNEWRNADFTDAERYTAFNSSTKQVAAKDLSGAEENISGALVRAAIEDAKIAVGSFIHTHPMNHAAFSDNDLELYFALLQQGITKQVVAALDDVMTLDFSQIDTTKGFEIIAEVKTRYQEIDDRMKTEFVQNHIDEVRQIGNVVLDGVETSSPIIQSMIAQAKNSYNQIFENFSETLDWDGYTDAVMRQWMKPLGSPELKIKLQKRPHQGLLSCLLMSVGK